MRDHNYFVYILASRARVLYIGVTSNLERRICQHKAKLVEGFTAKYKADRLVYFEHTNGIEGAIGREKQIKGWTRDKKVALIEAGNPTWRELRPWKDIEVLSHCHPEESDDEAPLSS